MSPINIYVHGCNGRMGLEILKCTIQQPKNFVVTGGSVRDSELVGTDIGKLASCEPQHVAVSHLSKTNFTAGCIIIDFTVSDSLAELLPYCVQNHLPLVTGTTGVSDALQDEVNAAAAKIPIVQSFNMSLGVNLLAALTEQAANALGEEFDLEILEIHHRHKRDAPSGTALMLGDAAAKGRNVLLNDKKAIERDGPRKSGDIGFAVMRGGGVIGDHTVMLAGESERIELTHRGHDRSIYAKGALKAAQWIADKPAGLYSMRDVLGL